MTRVLAADKGYKYEMLNPQLFKGSGFMNIELCNTLTENAVVDVNRYKHWKEKMVVENGIDIRGYDPEINFVEDNTVIDGEFQDERYFSHRLDNIREWLPVEPLEMPDDLCVINFRGGEYALYPDLFLTKDYWDEAIAKMKEKHPGIRFQVHTDDPKTAQYFFPDYECIQDIGLNWRFIRYAKHLILSNSSFAILPALLGNAEEIYAPRYWARRNTKVWALPSNFYRRFTYL